MSGAAALWFDWSVDLWPLVMGSLVGVTCGLLGAVFLVRRQALLGDAVSHSVLPGVAAGLLIGGSATNDGESLFGLSPTLVFVLAGALVAGVASTLLIEALTRWSRLKPETALGSVFPAFFAAGVLLVEAAARGAHFDLDCVFYGSLEVVGSFSATVPTLIVGALSAAVLATGYRYILASSFDPVFARSLGLRPGAVGAILVCLLSAAVVAAFEAAGAVLVVAFLTVPPATAYLLADRFQHVLLLSAALGLSSALVGCWATIALAACGLETSRAPTMALVAGVQFIAALLAAPRRGLAWRWLTHRQLQRRIRDENLLGALYRLTRHPGGERPATPSDFATIARVLGFRLHRLRQALSRLVRRGQVVRDSDGALRLTAPGRDEVERLIRAHRLWEIYLTSELGAAPDHVHESADTMEHYLQPALVNDLEVLLHHPPADPHGRAIPMAQRPA